MQTIETKPAPVGLSESCSVKHDAFYHFCRAVLEADRVIEQRRAQREQDKTEMPLQEAA